MKKGIPYRSGALLRVLLAVLLVLTALPASLPAQAEEQPEPQYIVKYKPSGAYLLEDPGVPFDVVSPREMRRLDMAGLLEWAEEDGIATLLDEPSPYYAASQWNLAMVQADGAFAANQLGQGVRVGVVDSGIASHPDLNGRVVGGHDYTNAESGGAGDQDRYEDTYGHGTMVAGIIAGGGEDGYLGVAPGAELVSLKCTSGKEVFVSAVARAIYGGVNEFRCDVLNLSLGLNSDYTTLREAVTYARSQGVVLVAACGNTGGSFALYPAMYEGVLGVGSVTGEGAWYSRSNHNESVFLTAPGVNLRTASLRGGYTTGTGTSFATPHVTGAVAVLLGAKPSLTEAQVTDALAKTAMDQGSEGYDPYYGYGILNVAGALQAVTGETPPTPPPAEDPSPAPSGDPPAPPDDEPTEEPTEEPTQEPSPAPGYADCARDSTCPLAAFEDLRPAAWYHDGVHAVLDLGLMKGVESGLFAPYTSTSRAMMVTVLWQMEGQPRAESAADFTDVREGAWYQAPVAWAAEHNIVAGFEDGTFAPDQSVTREQMVAFLYRYSRFKGGTAAPGGADRLTAYADGGTVSRYAREAMGWGVTAGLVSGMGDGTLQPKAGANRAQLATLLMKYTQLDA